MRKRFLTAIISFVLCMTLIFGSIISVSAEINITDIFAGLMGGDPGKINVSEALGSWLEEQINEESTIDKIINSIKNEFNGSTEDVEDDPNADTEEIIVIDKAEAGNIAELYNLSVNELKVGNPSFIKTQTASMDAQLSQQLQVGLGPVTGIVESLIGTKDIFAGVIDGTNQNTQIRTVYKAGNDVINNLPVSGKEYVACLTADDIKDYSITIFKSGAYRMHIDLVDAEGSAAQSGLSHVFDTTDKANATIELGTTSINTNIKLKYINNYVECQVNRDGEITDFTTNMGITFLFQQQDGSYSSKMPFLGIDFMKEGIIYNINTEYSGINFAQRKMGDADNNDKINSSDARLVLRVASGLEECAEDDLPYCDVTGDKKVSAGDAREILRASSGIDNIPSTEEALGIKPYVKSESTQAHVDDLLAILMAYQSAKDEEAKKELQDYYEDKYNNDSSDTPVPEETTTQEINTPQNKVEDFIDGIGDIIGGDGLDNIFNGNGLEDIIGGFLN